jgi:hypothetical protein
MNQEPALYQEVSKRAFVTGASGFIGAAANATMWPLPS